MSVPPSRSSATLIFAFGIFVAFAWVADVPVARGHGAEEHATGHQDGQVLGTVVASEPAALSVKTGAGATIRVLTTTHTRITMVNDTPAASTIEPGTRVAIRLKDGEGPATAEEIRVGTK